LQLVGEKGLEPSRVLPHQLLRLACLPIPPLALTHNYKGVVTNAIRDILLST
jgi:hypothetical protein